MDSKDLSSLLKASEERINELKKIPYDGLKEKSLELESMIKEFKEGGEQLLENNEILQIGIVGQVKAGKSSFLNSLFFGGEDVLPKASTPMTAGLTIIEYSEANSFDVEYFSEKDWKIFMDQDEEYRKREQEVRDNNPNAPEHIIKKELEKRTSEKIRSAHEMVEACNSQAREKIGKKKDIKDFYDIDDLQNVLEQFVGANGKYTSVVKSLYIKLKDDRLKGLRIVDTPGVNDPIVSRENRTRTFLHSCHGVFLLSSSTDFMGSGDVSFLNNRIGGSGIATVVLLASKFDSVLQDIGAELEMKKEEKGDLVDIVEIQKKKNRRRLRELSDTIDEHLRGRIQLDFTAGIGYSIAHKPSNKWDNVERQVVAQMKRFYPDYFDNERDLKDNFEELANIANIREKYLEGIFLANKESIISEKVSAYFTKNQEEIKTTIVKILEDFDNRRKQLNETTLAEIQKQKQMQGRLFDGLKSTFEKLFSNFASHLQSDVNLIANRVRFNEIRSIPTELTSGPITCKGWLWGHNTNETQYDQVNTHALGEQIREAVEDYSQSWNEEWKKLFKDYRNGLSDKLGEAIAKFEKSVKSSSFNDSYYRNIIDSALDQLRNNKELQIGDLITDYQRQGDNIANQQFEPSGTYDLKEDYVDSHLRESLRQHNINLVNQLRVMVDGLRDDMKREVNRNLKDAVAVINEMKTSFAESLKIEGDAYLASLEKEMMDKTNVLKQLDDVIKCIDGLNKLYQ